MTRFTKREIILILLFFLFVISALTTIYNEQRKVYPSRAAYPTPSKTTTPKKTKTPTPKKTKSPTPKSSKTPTPTPKARGNVLVEFSNYLYPVDVTLKGPANYSQTSSSYSEGGGYAYFEKILAGEYILEAVSTTSCLFKSEFNKYVDYSRPDPIIFTLLPGFSKTVNVGGVTVDCPKPKQFTPTPTGQYKMNLDVKVIGFDINNITIVNLYNADGSEILYAQEINVNPLDSYIGTAKFENIPLGQYKIVITTAYTCSNNSNLDRLYSYPESTFNASYSSYGEKTIYGKLIKECK